MGDRVFIVKKVWSTTRPSDKLDYPLTRQHYRIQRKAGHSFVLDIPAGWKGTKTFHADRLRLFPNNPLPGQKAPEPPSEAVGPEGATEDEFEVDKVTASRLHYGKLQYQVEWKGWDPDATWQYADNLKNAPEALKAYHEEHPDQAGPPLRLYVTAGNR